MRYGFAAALIAAVLGSGCTTGAAPKGVTYNEVARVPVGEVIGLTRQEMQSRLRLSAPMRLSLREARLEGEAVLTHVTAWRMARDTRCPSGMRWPQLMLEKDGKKIAEPEFVFRGDRVEAIVHRPRLQEAFPADGEITSTCMRAQNDNGRTFANTILAIPLLPVMGVMSTVNTAASKDINGPLARLPLGAQAPGGLEAYLANLPANSFLKEREGLNAQVDFYFNMREGLAESQRGLPDASVYFVDGKVARFTSMKDCVLTKDRAFSCDRMGP